MRFLPAVVFLLLGTLLPIEAVAAPRSNAGATVTAKPAIDLVRGRTVRVRVPAGLQSVTLERCTSARSGRWEIVGTKITGQTAGTVEFQLPQAVSRRFLRVKGAMGAVAPGSLVGAKLFLADPALTGGGVFSSNALGQSASAGAPSLKDGVGSASLSAGRTVSESDIWRVEGHRLYFFNELRGLQVFDITNPDDPALLGQLRAPGRGEQMYLLDASHVALLVRGSDYLQLPVLTLSNSIVAGGDANLGSVVIVDVANGRPAEVARVEYRGTLRESRRVGSVLYVVSEVWANNAGGLEVTSFDLSDPSQPVKRDTLNVGGWGGLIHATDRFLFVVRSSEDWSRSIIDVIDISSPTGALARRGTLQTAGRVDDKFKMHLDGDVFTAVSAVPRRWSDNWWNEPAADPANASRTKIETFSLTDPNTPVKLGSLELGVGETVRATRFDEKRVYVVTFFQIDPLWVVDLTNPATPTLLGELEVPGFSNYIEPLGDRLVAVGIVGGQTAVSLFDVSDPAHPAVLSQLPLGDGSSWSEANWDEKAFNIVPEENLIVVPFSGYDSATGYAARVQLIDLTRTGLVKRGVIDHGLTARRTAVKGNRLLAISSSDLVTVDFADRDHPRVSSEVEIAWRVDRVFLAGNHLLQIGGSTSGRKGQPQTLSVSTASDPDTVLTTVDLDPATVLGATVRDGRLYVAQRNPEWYSNLVYALDSAANTAAPAANPFILSVFDLTSLPALPRLARTESTIELGYVSELDAVWPSPGVLVWVRPQRNDYYPYYIGRPVLGVTPITGAPVLTIGDTFNFVTYGNATSSSGFSQTTSSGSATITPVPSLPPPPSTLTVGSAGTYSVDYFNSSPVSLVVVNSSPSSGRVARGMGGTGAITFTPSLGSGATVSPGASLGKIGAGTLQLSSSSFVALPWWGNSNAGFEALVFNVSTPTTPVLAAKLNIRTGSTGDWSDAFAAAGKLYVSAMAYEDFVTIGEKTEVPVTAPSRRYRHFLKVVDLADPALPVIGSDINIPGRLIGISNAGARLYTVGCRYETDGAPTHSRALHVSTFDGTAATFVDQLTLADYGASYALDLDTVLIGVRGTAGPDRIQAWQLDGSAKFQLRSETATDDVSTLAVLRGLLVTGGYSGPRQLFDVTDAVNVRALGNFPRSVNYWSSADLSKADGSPSRGLWEPLGNYGVESVEFAP